MAEPTYEQVMQALQAADAAGNTADAQQLAQMAASMMSKQPAVQATAQPAAQKESETVQGSFGRRLASAADITIGGVLPAIAQTVAYPLARFGGKSPEQAQAATERIVGAIDKPFGKAFGVSNTPEYQTETGRQIVDFIGSNIQKGTKWLSENTGIPQADIESYLNSAGIAATPLVKPTLQAAGNVTKETAATVKAGVQAPFEAQIRARNERLSAEDYARGPQIEAAKEAQRLGFALKPTDLSPSIGAKLTTSMAGGEGLERIASANIGNTRKVALNEMGLPPNTQLNGITAFSDARMKVAQPYNEIRSLPTMVADQNTIKALQDLRPDEALISSSNDAKVINATIDRSIDKVSAGLDGAQLLKNVQDLRQRARKTYNNKSATVEQLDAADTNLAIANALETMIESNVTDPKLLTKFRDARQKMARTYAYEGATDFNTGVVDVKRLARITAKDNTMTGDIASLGKIAGNFPDAFTTQPVKQGVDQARIARSGLAGTLGGLAGYALGDNYAGAAVGSLVGAGVGEAAQALAARRMASPEYQAGLTVQDNRIPVVRQAPVQPPIPQNRSVVPYQAPVEVLPPAAPQYQPNFTIPQGTPVRTQAPDVYMDMYLPAPSAEASLGRLRAEDTRRYNVAKALDEQAAARAEAAAASQRAPTRGGVELQINPLTGAPEVAGGIKGATPSTFQNYGSTLSSAASKVSEGKMFDMTLAEKAAWKNTQVDLAEVVPGFKALSDKTVAEKMLDRQWIQDAAIKAREKALAFEQVAMKAKNIQEVNAARANRERMLDLAEKMDESLRGARPSTAGKTQGPKTRAAFREGLLSTPTRIELSGMAKPD
jgi:hypothetical protein